MKKLFTACLVLLAFASVASAQECKCEKTPFAPTPPCFEVCASTLLRALDLVELQLLFDLSRESAQRIDEMNRDKSREWEPTLREYREMVTPDEFSKCLEKINKLTEDQLKFLAKPAAERQQIRKTKAFKELFAVTDAALTRASGP